VYKKKDKHAPKKLKQRGKILLKKFANSASIKLKFSGLVNIEVPQKSVPTPIIISLVKKPIKILGTDRTIKGSNIFQGDSWAPKITGRNPFGNDKKVKYVNLIE
jgi:hypothetical protein